MGVKISFLRSEDKNAQFNRGLVSRLDHYLMLEAFQSGGKDHAIRYERSGIYEVHSYEG